MSFKKNYLTPCRFPDGLQEKKGPFAKLQIGGTGKHDEENSDPLRISPCFSSPKF